MFLMHENRGVKKKKKKLKKKKRYDNKNTIEQRVLLKLN